MRRYLSTSLLFALLFTSLAVTRAADDAEEKPSPDAAKQKKVEELTKELERVRAELAKQGVSVPPLAPLPGGLAPPLGAPPVLAHDPKLIGENQQKVRAQQEKITALTKKHGPDSAEVRKATEEMHKLMAAAGYYRGDSPPPPAGPAGAYGRPGVGVPGLEQFRSLLEGTGDMPAPGETAEMGQRLVMAGLELQLKELANAIRDSDDEEARQTMTEELRDLVDMVVSVREKHRTRQIERLQKRLIELQDQAESAENADQVLKRLLSPPQKESQDEPVEGP